MHWLSQISSIFLVAQDLSGQRALIYITPLYTSELSFRFLCDCPRRKLFGRERCSVFSFWFRTKAKVSNLASIGLELRWMRRVDSDEDPRASDLEHFRTGSANCMRLQHAFPKNELRREGLMATSHSQSDFAIPAQAPSWVISYLCKVLSLITN